MAGARRLRKAEPVRFAVVEMGRMPQPSATEPVLELVLNTGERLRIGTGVADLLFRPCLTEDPLRLGFCRR